MGAGPAVSRLPQPHLSGDSVRPRGRGDVRGECGVLHRQCWNCIMLVISHKEWRAPLALSGHGKHSGR